MKGKEKRKGKEKETCSRASTNNLALILTSVISFGVTADDLYAFQPLKGISTVDSNLLMSLEQKLALRDRSLVIPCGGERGGWTIRMAPVVISDATNMKIAVQKAALQNLRS